MRRGEVGTSTHSSTPTRLRGRACSSSCEEGPALMPPLQHYGAGPQLAAAFPPSGPPTPAKVRSPLSAARSPLSMTRTPPVRIAREGPLLEDAKPRDSPPTPAKVRRSQGATISAYSPTDSDEAVDESRDGADSPNQADTQGQTEAAATADRVIDLGLAAKHLQDMTPQGSTFVRADDYPVEPTPCQDEVRARWPSYITPRFAIPRCQAHTAKSPSRN